MHSRRTLLLAAAAALLALAGPAAAALFAVDLGSEFLKVSIVKPGRIPISIVINEMSKRKTPALVGFVEGDRLIGEEAASLLVRYPERVFARAIDWLGRPADDPALAAAFKAAYRPYSLVPAPNRTSPAAAAVAPIGAGGSPTSDGEIYSAEEVVASLLEYAKQLAQAAADGMPITDCVLVVPPSFTPQQRQALLDAARLAGLTTMGLVHSHAAAALQYGIERDFANRTEDVVFYDIGAASLQASLVRFSAFTNARNQSISQFEVRDVVWRENIGGEELELVLLEHFASEFNAKLGDGQDVRSSPRAMAKLRKQVKRTKEMLSANSEAPLSVEELWLDKDFRSTITREKFEELAGDFWTRAAAPLLLLLERNEVQPSELGGVELLGGTSRVPRLKAALSEALGGRVLDMHLDADEATVLGAGLFAANLSTTFRLRQFGMADKLPYSVSLSLEGEDAPRMLVPALKRLPTKRALHLSNLTADSVAFNLTLDNAPAAMPCCHRAYQLGAFNVSGIHAVIAKYNESGKVSIHTQVDQSGLFHVSRADATLEVMVEVREALPPPPASNATTNATAAGNSTAAGNTTAGNSTTSEGAPAPAPVPAPAPAPAPAAGNTTGNATDAGNGTETQYVTKLVPRTIRLPLTVSGGFTAPGMNASELEASRRVMRILRNRDDAKREQARARNDLESYIISMREKMEAGSDEELVAVTTEAQREKFAAELAEAEDWLYGDGEAVDGTEYRARLRVLRTIGDPMELRAAERAARPKVVKLASSFLEMTRAAVSSWPDLKPWLNASDIAALVAKVEDFSKWLSGKQAEQAKREDHEEPAFKADEVTGWVGRLERAYKALSSKRKPRPPPAPKVKPGAAKAANNATASGNGTEAGGAGAGGGAKQQQKGKDAPPAAEEEVDLELELEAPEVDAEEAAQPPAAAAGGDLGDDDDELGGAHDELRRRTR